MKQLTTTYGALDDIESVITDLFVCAPGSRASALSKGVRSDLLADIAEAITEYFNAIRPRPAPFCDQLAQRTRHGDVVVTFNYDLSVERSLQRAGLWHINDGYGFRLTPQGQSSPVRVIKLHGSTNWRGRLLDSGVGVGAAHDAAEERPVLCFRPDLEYLGFPDLVDPFCGQIPDAASVAPIIIPALKTTFFRETTVGMEWQTVWDMLWSEAAMALNEAKEIVLIGYGMSVADEHARSLLLGNPNKTARVTICAHSATVIVAEEFRRAGCRDVTMPVNPTFAGWIFPNPPAAPTQVVAEARPIILELQRHRSSAGQVLKQATWFFSSLGFPQKRIPARERARMQKQLAQLIDRLAPYNVGLAALSGKVSMGAAGYILLDGLLRTMLEAVNLPVAATNDAVEVFQDRCARLTREAKVLRDRPDYAPIATERDVLLQVLAAAPKPERLEQVLEHWHESDDCHNVLHFIQQYETLDARFVTERPQRYNRSLISRLVEQYRQHAILLSQELCLLLALQFTAAGKKRFHDEIQEKHFVDLLKHSAVCPALRNLAAVLDRRVRNAIAHTTPEVRLDLRTCTFRDQHKPITLSFDELYNAVNRLTLTAAALLTVPFQLQQYWLSVRLDELFGKRPSQ